MLGSLAELKAMTAIAGDCSRIRRVASTPSISGMCQSMITRSGAVRERDVDAGVPVARLCDDLVPSVGQQQGDQPPNVGNVIDHDHTQTGDRRHISHLPRSLPRQHSEDGSSTTAGRAGAGGPKRPIPER